MVLPSDTRHHGTTTVLYCIFFKLPFLFFNMRHLAYLVNGQIQKSTENEIQVHKVLPLALVLT